MERIVSVVYYAAKPAMKKNGYKFTGPKTYYYLHFFQSANRGMILKA